MIICKEAYIETEKPVVSYARYDLLSLSSENSVSPPEFGSCKVTTSDMILGPHGRMLSLSSASICSYNSCPF